MQQFAIDKSVNVFIEYLAEEFIKAYWERRGKRIQVYENPAGDLAGKQKFDRTDSLGNKWEVKNDEMAWKTGRSFLEDQTFDRTEADYYLIFLHGRAVILTHQQYQQLRQGDYECKTGGDGHRSSGKVPPVDAVLAVGEVVSLTRYI